jgi:multiple sugar transport system substrate-binding protein
MSPIGRQERRITRRDVLRFSLGLGAAALASACGATPTPAPAAATQPVAGATEVPAAQATVVATSAQAGAGQTVTVRVMMYMSDAQLAKAQSDFFGPFEKDNPGLKIDHIVRPGDGNESQQKLRAMVAGGDPPDIYDEFRTANGQAGEALDLMPFVDKSKLDLTKVPKGIMDTEKWQDGLYGMPMCAGGQFCLVLNRDLFDAAAISYPTSTWSDPKWTWADFTDIAVKLTKKNGDRYEQFGVSDLGDWILFPFQMWDAYLVDPKSKAVTCDDPNVIAAYQAVLDLAKKDHAMPDVSMQQANAVWGDADPMLSGKAGISSYGLWSHTLYRKALDEGVNWAFLPYPKGRPEATVHTECNGGKSPGIVKTAKHPNEAWTFINWEFDQQHLAKFLGRMPADEQGQKDWAKVFYGSYYDKIRPEVLWEGWKSDPSEEPLYQNPKNVEVVTKVLQPGWDQVWADKISVKQWLTEAKPKIEEILNATA